MRRVETGGSRHSRAVRPRVLDLHLGDHGEPQGSLSYALQPGVQRERHHAAARVGSGRPRHLVSPLGARLRGMRGAQQLHHHGCLLRDLRRSGEPPPVHRRSEADDPHGGPPGLEPYSRQHHGDDAHEAACRRPVDVRHGDGREEQATTRQVDRAQRVAGGEAWPSRRWSSRRSACRLRRRLAALRRIGRSRALPRGRRRVHREPRNRTLRGLRDDRRAAAGPRASRWSAKRLGSVGKPIPGVRIEIDKEASSAPAAASGEVVIYGHGIASGYLTTSRTPPARTIGRPTAALRTGDLGRLDADGYLYITGRTKEALQARGRREVRRPGAARRAAHPQPVHPPVRRLRRGPGRTTWPSSVPDMGALRTWSQDAGHRGRW